MMSGKPKERLLSVQEWHALALSGQPIPMRFTVEGDSMRPLIRRRRDVVMLLPMDRPPLVGDIVLFVTGDEARRYVLHRVWEVDGGRVRTFGDGCLRPDGWMPADHIWGRVVCIRRGCIRINADGFFWRAWTCLGVRIWRACGWLRRPRRAAAALRRRIVARLEHDRGC